MVCVISTRLQHVLKLGAGRMIFDKHSIRSNPVNDMVRQRLIGAFVLLIACLWLSRGGMAEVRPQLTTLPAPVASLLVTNSIPVDSMSVFVQEVSERRPLLAVAAKTPRNPASTIKLLTTFVSLETLGPAYTWVTEVYTAGLIHNGRLSGDLIVKGHGDPFLVTEYLWKLLRGLRDRGLQDISGDLVIDNGYFKPEIIDSGAFDGKPYRTYNAVPDAALVNFQSVHFTFIPDEKSHKIRIIADPWPANLNIINSLTFQRGACRGRKFRIGMRVTPREEGVKVHFSGDYPLACGTHRWNRVVLKPTEMLYGVIKSLWEDMGGSLEGELKIGTLSDDARPFYSMESRPLAELIRGMNKFSNNVMARQLLLTLGAEYYGPPGTERKGIDAIKDWLRLNALEFPDLVLENGAGLSRNARISVEDLGRFLLTAYSSAFMPEFLSSLPLSGMEGTMRKRFRNDPLAGKIRAKTGTLDGVSALAGYLTAHNGKTYVVVIIENHPRLRKRAAIKVQDRLLQWLAER